MRVLIFADWYLPGFKAGGPIRSIANLVEALGDQFEFSVVTRDRDWLQPSPYPETATGVWHSVGKARVIYLTPKDLSSRTLAKVIQSAAPDILYFNSLFSPRFSILPLTLRRLGRITKTPVIVAPRGELAANALALKKTKKRLSLLTTKSMGLYRDVIWQASTPYEAADIRTWFGEDIELMIAPNLPAQLFSLRGANSRRPKVAGQLKMLFLGRISRMKNLDGALKMLMGLSGELEFNIYGPLEDKDRDYWQECQDVIALLPPNITVKYFGDIEHDKVAAVMADHDLFFMPTLGENFGHVVPEALISGCPVLISDRTPWRDLEEKGVGWSLPLSGPERFRAAISTCVEMGPAEHTRLSNAAGVFGREVARDQRSIQQSRDLLERARSRLNGSLQYQSAA